MIETVEFRIPEKEAQAHLRQDEGEVLGGSVRKIILPLKDERTAFIGQIDAEYHKRGRSFYTACILNREYTRKEMESAEFLLLQTKNVFEPAGEECGTLYDETVACSRCGLNRVQKSELMLDLKKVRKHTDIAKTIAGEVIVSRQFKQAWEKNKLTGLRFGNVFQKGRTPTVSADWYQPIIESSPLEVVKPTIAGTDLFNIEDAEQYRCKDHVLGLGLFSELTISRNGYGGADFSITKQAFGWKQGLLMPERPLILSQKAWDCLCKAEIKGYSVEVVHVK